LWEKTRERKVVWNIRPRCWDARQKGAHMDPYVINKYGL
jgi:hypothetical protein